MKVGPIVESYGVRMGWVNTNCYQFWRSVGKCGCGMFFIPSVVYISLLTSQLSFVCHIVWCQFVLFFLGRSKSTIVTEEWLPPLWQTKATICPYLIMSVVAIESGNMWWLFVYYGVFCWVVGAITPPGCIVPYMGCNIIVMNLYNSVLG